MLNTMYECVSVGLLSIMYVQYIHANHGRKWNHVIKQFGSLPLCQCNANVSCCFLRASSACKQSNLQHTEACHTAEDEAYWESLGNIISEDKLKLWDIVEDQLKQYQWVTTTHTHTQS